MAGSGSTSASESKRSRPFFSPLPGGGDRRLDSRDHSTAPWMVGSRLLSLVRSCRPYPLGWLSRSRRIHDRRPKHFLFAHEDSELAVERLTDRHAVSALHELGSLTRQLQHAVSPTNSPVFSHHPRFLNRHNAGQIRPRR